MFFDRRVLGMHRRAYNERAREQTESGSNAGEIHFHWPLLLRAHQGNKPLRQRLGSLFTFLDGPDCGQDKKLLRRPQLRSVAALA